MHTKRTADCDSASIASLAFSQKVLQADVYTPPRPLYSKKYSHRPMDDTCSADHTICAFRHQLDAPLPKPNRRPLPSAGRRRLPGDRFVEPFEAHEELLEATQRGQGRGSEGPIGEGVERGLIWFLWGGVLHGFLDLRSSCEHVNVFFSSDLHLLSMQSPNDWMVDPTYLRCLR